MTTNFKIDQLVYVVQGNDYFDLHNNYSFKEILISPPDKKIELAWNRLDEDWVDGSNPQEVRLIFDQVSYFEMSKNFVLSDVSTLEEIGYKEAGDNDLDWLYQQEFSEDHYHMFFRFLEDEFIRIYSETAEVKRDQ